MPIVSAALPLWQAVQRSDLMQPGMDLFNRTGTMNVNKGFVCGYVSSYAGNTAITLNNIKALNPI
ncbi:MAG TPA: hypothetical protein VLC92_20000 [Rhodocyclaceae bacterium]|nr:hypothetical protein [Rhodocyclaceae bacterium]